MTTLTSSPVRHAGIKGESARLHDAARGDGEEVLRLCQSMAEGLTEQEAQRRLESVGPNEIAAQRPDAWPRRLLRTIRNPLVILLATLAAVSGEHKLVRVKTDEYQLFDLAADPLEQHDLAPQGGPVYEALEAEVDAFSDDLKERARKGRKVKVDEGEADELEALGYLEE